ncbi:MAG: PilZ domain-containing protein [Polyangiaceae bacterium]|nr:PilZ domain-containing protein [Polyangiaceae bacterium]
MNRREERRAAGIHRVPVQALVELCGLNPREAPAFEAESIDVSGRGLKVRTGFVPELGTPLVCRFEERGQEIIAEGVVAWANPDSGGGEFGLMFTALDQNSVGVLRELTGLGKSDDAGDEEVAPARDEPAELASESPAAPPSAAPPAPPSNDPGARVRLHIEGLGAPMKALVRSGTRSRVKVGSTLEMLRVGRRLEIENLERSSRRAACVDGVEVMLDPQSGVPHLVVALHYQDGVDVTPDPTVIDDEPRLDDVAAERSLARPVVVSGPRPPRIPEEDREPPAVCSATRAAARPASPSVDESVDQAGEEEDDEGAPYTDGDSFPPEDEVMAEASRFQSRVTVAAQQAGEWVRRTGGLLGRLSGQAAIGVAQLARDTGTRMAKGASEGRRGTPPRRTTAVPPSGVLASDGRRLRPQNPRAKTEAVPAPQAPPSHAAKRLGSSNLLRRVGLGVGLMALAATVGAFAVGGNSSATVAVAGAEPSTAPSMAPIRVVAVGPQASAVPGPAKLSSQPAKSPNGIIADVPLFGPTPMATMEPAPLGPAPEAGRTQEARNVEEIPALKAQPVPDETFDTAVPKGSDSWGRGQVHLPTIHRLRLDKAGASIQGAPSSSGFSVVLPGVKVMENGSAISKRDERIVKVLVENTGQGAKVTFRFRSEVPPYRVRLRKDFVEFLISAPK